MKKLNMKILIVFSLVVASVSPMISNFSSATTPAEKPHFRFGYFYYGLFQNFDPVIAMRGSVAWMFLGHVIETLWDYNYYTGEWDPQLAVGFEQVDPLTQIIHLREGVTFHDGTPFNASCVKWNYDRYLELTEEPTQQYHANYWWDTDGMRPYKTPEWDIDWIPEGQDYPAINETIVINNTAVMFKYNIPYYSRIDWEIYSPTFYAAYQHSPWEGVATLVGTGWLKYVAYDPFDRIVHLVANPDYWDGAPPYIEEAECIFFDNINTAQNALIAGEVDYIIDPADPAFFNNSDEFDLIWQEPPFGVTGETLELEMNVNIIPTYLRKAMSYAFNYDGYITIEREGKAVRAGGVVPTNNQWYNASIPLPYYNLTIARQVMIDQYPSETTAAELTNETTTAMDEKWINQANTAPLDVFGFWYEPSGLWCVPFLEEASRKIGVEPNMTAKPQSTMGEYYASKEKRTELPSYLIYPTHGMGPDPRGWLTTLYDANASWNPSFVDDPDLTNWSWYYYVLNDTSSPTVQEVINWMTEKLQTEIFPAIWMAQYPRYGAKPKDWVGDPGFWNNDFYNFSYSPLGPVVPEIKIPGYTLTSIGVSCAIALISFKYLKRKKIISKI